MPAFRGICRRYICFVYEGEERAIIRQNESYVEDITVRMGERIDDLLKSARASIHTMAYLYGKSMESTDGDALPLCRAWDVFDTCG